MNPWLEVEGVIVYHGDCIEVMRSLPADSVHAVVTDPPYGLEFMGKDWDAFRLDDPGTMRHRGERVGNQGTTHDEQRGAFGRVAYGAGKHPRTSRCSSCGKRDQFRNPHDCDGHWISEVINPNTAPPSSIAFQNWSHQWILEAYRVLKPGGHLLAFGGTRTWHRLAVAIEDAGFEVRDSIAWMYGSGFPKSLDVSKAIDKRRDDAEDAAKVASFFCRHNTLGTLSEFREHLNASIVGDRHSGGSAQGWTTETTTGVVKPRVPTWEQWIALKELLQLDDDMDAEVWRLNGRKGQPGEAWAEREVTGQHEQSTAQQVWMQNYSDHVALPPKERKDKPATPAAQQWQGWGTALKPAFEPIVVARKPLIITVAENVQAHGTGALNIDATRINMGDEYDPAKVQRQQRSAGDVQFGSAGLIGTQIPTYNSKGRWPANVILDESQAAELDKQADERPARFFYVPKAGSSERPREGDTAHPTVKPLDLMRYLVRLVTPPGGTVLEPFAGSGTTLEACIVEGLNVIGIELTEDYLPLIRQRITKPIEPVLL